MINVPVGRRRHPAQPALRADADALAGPVAARTPRKVASRSTHGRRGRGARGRSKQPADGAGRQAASPATAATRRARAQGRRHARSQRPHTAWLGDADRRAAGYDDGRLRPAAATALRAPRTDRQAAHRTRRSAPPATGNAPTCCARSTAAAAAVAGTGSPRSLLDIKQDAARADAPAARQGRGAVSREDNDTFELLGMLYRQIEREVRTDAPGRAVAAQLQVPLLRVALQDRGFFVRAATSGAATAQHGRRIRRPLARATTKSIRKCCTAAAARSNTSSRTTATTRPCSTNANRELQASLQRLARKAEIAERRHVEAARGKEKLEIAKRRADRDDHRSLGRRPAPAEVRARAAQPGVGRRAHPDVAAPRRGIGRVAAPARRPRAQIVANCCRSGQHAPSITQLAQQHRSCAGRRSVTTSRKPRRSRAASTSVAEDEDDPASRTELAMKLKARARLGERLRARASRNSRRAIAGRTGAYEHLRTLPYGTWIEFVTNQQGDTRAPAPVVVQPGHRQRAVREPARPARGRTDRSTAWRGMIAVGQARIVTAERAACRSRVAGHAQCAAQLRRPAASAKQEAAA